MKQYQQIKCEVSERILTITIDRPEKANAYTEQMREEMISALDEAYNDDEIRVIIFTANPDGKNYCAGMDLSAAGSTFDYTAVSEMNHRDGGGQLCLKIYESNKPIIGAINGPAVGIGFTMTLPMDFRIVSNKAKLGAVFVRRGIVNDGCSSYFLPRIIGMANAMYMVMTGKVITAAEAEKLGLVTQLAEPEDVYSAARALALDLAKNTAPVSVALVRRLMWQMQGASDPMEAHEIESRLLYWVGQQKDADEGIRSFLEKRSPEYSMSPTKDMPSFYPWWPKQAFRNR